MDPNMAYLTWKEAIRDGNYELAAQAREDLLTWLDRGGFEPKWTEAQRNAFYLVSVLP